jgi:hypothetical protein
MASWLIVFTGKFKIKVLHNHKHLMRLLQGFRFAFFWLKIERTKTKAQKARNLFPYNLNINSFAESLFYPFLETKLLDIIVLICVLVNRVKHKKHRRCT